MARSPFFARIKSDVCATVRRVPKGRVVTYASIGAALDVPARHVAYIVATLDDIERDTVPWHRVAGEAGVLSKASPARLEAQIAALRAEGLGVLRDRIVDFESVRAAPKPPKRALTKRPADAPIPPSRGRRK